VTRAVLPILSNRPEIRADRDLQELVDGAGDRLYAKIPVAEVLDVDDAEVARAADRRFLLMASFDFVVSRDNRAIFCVEIDGRRHSFDHRTVERDRKKDAACEAAGLPILRVTSDLALRKAGERSILKYVADCYYLFEAFDQAQQSGLIPWDEPFDRSSLTEFDSDGRPIRSIDGEAIRYLALMEQAGRLPSGIPDTIVVTVPPRRNVRCVAFLAVAQDRFIFADVQVRDFRFVGIRPSEVAESLAFAELVDQAKCWLLGEAVAINRIRLARTFHELQVAINRGLLLLARMSTSNSQIAGEVPPLRIHFGRSN